MRLYKPVGLTGMKYEFVSKVYVLQAIGWN